MSCGTSELIIFKIMPKLKIEFDKIVSVLRNDHFLIVDDLDNSPHSIKNILICWIYNHKNRDLEHGFISVLRPLSGIQKFGLGELYLGFDEMVHIRNYIVKDIFIQKSDLIGKQLDEVVNIHIENEHVSYQLNILFLNPLKLNQR